MTHEAPIRFPAFDHFATNRATIIARLRRSRFISAQGLGETRHRAGYSRDLWGTDDWVVAERPSGAAQRVGTARTLRRGWAWPAFAPTPWVAARGGAVSRVRRPLVRGADPE